MPHPHEALLSTSWTYTLYFFIIANVWRHFHFRLTSSLEIVRKFAQSTQRFYIMLSNQQERDLLPRKLKIKMPKFDDKSVPLYDPAPWSRMFRFRKYMGSRVTNWSDPERFPATKHDVVKARKNKSTNTKVMLVRSPYTEFEGFEIMQIS